MRISLIRLSLAALLVSLGVALCGCSDSPATMDGVEPAPPTVETVSYEDTRSVDVLLLPMLSEVEAITVSCGGENTAKVETAASVKASVRVALESLDDTRAVDRAAFVMFEILQRSTTATAAIRVDIEALAPAESALLPERIVSRTYKWDPRLDHPYDVPDSRQDYIDVWRMTTAAPGSMYRCVGGGEILGRFLGIDASRVTEAALGDLPELEEPVFFHSEYEMRPNGLGFGFELPEQIDSFVADTAYEAACTLGYSGSNGQGRPLYDLTLHLPHGSVLEFVVRDAATGAEIVTRGDDEGPSRELILKPETGLAQRIGFSFPKAGRYEVFLRIAGGDNSARAKGVWLDVSSS